jgi:YD repeat-containing protein
VEQYQYVLDEAGNIDKIEHLDGSFWDYAYDDRYRLTDALLKNANETIAATYAYGYDERDNMTSKTMPWRGQIRNPNIEIRNNYE